MNHLHPTPTQASDQVHRTMPFSSSSLRWAAAGGIALFAGLSLFSTDDGPVLCPYRVCTDGGYCPGCGLTRAGGHLLRGQFATSWAQHPYMVLLAAQLLCITVAWLAGSARVFGTDLRSTLMKARVKILAANAVLLVGIWIWRMASNDIPLPFQAN